MCVDIELVSMRFDGFLNCNSHTLYFSLARSLPPSSSIELKKRMKVYEMVTYSRITSYKIEHFDVKRQWGTILSVIWLCRILMWFNIIIARHTTNAYNSDDELTFSPVDLLTWADFRLTKLKCHNLCTSIE